MLSAFGFLFAQAAEAFVAHRLCRPSAASASAESAARAPRAGPDSACAADTAFQVSWSVAWALLHAVFALFVKHSCFAPPPLGPLAKGRGTIPSQGPGQGRERGQGEHMASKVGATASATGAVAAAPAAAQQAARKSQPSALTNFVLLSLLFAMILHANRVPLLLCWAQLQTLVAAHTGIQVGPGIVTTYWCAIAAAGVGGCTVLYLLCFIPQRGKGTRGHEHQD